jgi:hypothetical protein
MTSLQRTFTALMTVLVGVALFLIVLATTLGN